MNPKKDIKEDITENTGLGINLKISTWIKVIVFSVLSLLSLVGTYNTIKAIDKDMLNKVNKEDFDRHKYIDSVKWNYFEKDLKKDLNLIKRELNISEDN